MAGSNENRITLSLDDSGFSNNAKRAGDAARALEGNLGSLAAQAGKTGTAFAGAGASLKGFADGVGTLQRSLAASVAGLSSTVANSFAQLAAQGRSATREAQDAATAQIDARMRVLNAEIETNRQLLVSRGKMHAELRKVESDANAKAMALEIEADKLRRSNNPGAAAAAASADAEAARYRRSADAIKVQVAAVEQWINNTRTEQATRNVTIASLENERQAAVSAATARRQLASVSAAVGNSNAQEVTRMRAMARARDATSAAEKKKALDEMAMYRKQLADQEARDAIAAEEARIRAERRAAADRRRLAEDEAKAAKARTKAVEDMWEGLKKTYDGTKIEPGLKASVASAADDERTRIKVQALNLPKAQEQAMFAGAQDLSDKLKFVSPQDAVKSKMSAISTVGFEHAGTVDATLERALQLANNMENLGAGQGDLQATLRGIYGVAQVRQQAGDPQAMLRTFDLINKNMVASGSKTSLQDVDALLRRLGPLATTLSDKGLLGMIALADRSKAAGRDDVPAVNALAKMMEAYATGKGKSGKAAEEFVSAGLVGQKGLALAKDGAHVFTDKKGAVKDVAGWQQDPVKAMQAMVPQIIEYTRRAENKKTFYQGRDDGAADSQMIAVAKYLQNMGMQKAGIQAVMTAGAPDTRPGLDKQVQVTAGADSVEQTAARLQESYAQKLATFNVQLQGFKTVVGDALLGPLGKVLEVATSIVTMLRDFGQNNPIALQMTVAGAALAGAGLKLKGFMDLLGSLGSASGVLRQLAGDFNAVQGATAASNTAAQSSGGAFAWLTSRLTDTWDSIKLGASTHMPALNASVLGMSASFQGGGSAVGRITLGLRSIGTATTAMAKIVGGAFLRMVPLLGELLLAWDFANLLAGMKIGGARIDTWLVSWADRTVVWALNMGSKIAAIFKTGGTAAADAEIAKRNAELKKRLEANDVLFKDEEEKDKKPEQGKKPDQGKTPPVAKPKPAPAKQSPSAIALATLTTPAADDGKGKDKGDAKEANSLEQALKESEKKVDEQKSKLESILIGAERVDALRSQAEEAIRGKFPDGGSAPNADKDGEKRAKLLDSETERLLGAEQIKAIESANQRIATASNEADAAMQRLADRGALKQSDAFRALNKEIERTEERLGTGITTLGKWQQAKSQALFEQSRVDALNYAAELSTSNRKDGIDLLPTERARKQAELDLTRQTEDAKYEALRKTIEKSREDAVKAIKDDTTLKEEARNRIDEIDKQAQEARNALDAEYTQRRENRRQKEVQAMASAADKIAIEWQDTPKALDAIGGNMMNNFVSMITSSLSTGRLAIGDFIKGVLADIANAKLKEVLAAPLSSAINSGMSWLGSALFGAGGSASAVPMLSASELGPVSIPTLSSLSSVPVWPYANGGVMTGTGPMQLRKYANGGIASSPQVALYGEGSMNEAFVPLPDGRTIPVSLNQQGPGPAGAAPAVAVNVINQTSQPVNAQQSGTPRFDGRQYVLDVVLSAATAPGAFRSSIKEALK